MSSMCKYLLFGIILIFLLVSCGYHLEGRPESFNSKWHSIYIPVWENPTSEIQLGEIMAQALRERFALSGILKISSKEKADLILYGKIVSVDVGALSYDVYTKTLERRVWVKARAWLVERSTGKIIWKNDNLSRFEDYPVINIEGGSIDPGREEALHKMAYDISEIIYHQITSFGF